VALSDKVGWGGRHWRELFRELEVEQQEALVPLLLDI